MLAAGELQIGAGRTATRREGVAAGGIGSGLRIGRLAVLPTDAMRHPVGVHVVLYARRQERPQLIERAWAEMQITVSDGEPALRIWNGRHEGADLGIHSASP